MKGGWRYEWIVDWDIVWSQPFLDEWRRQLDSSPNAHVFYEPPLVRSWLETFGRIQDMSARFLLATDGADRSALLPLLAVRSRWKDAWRRTLSPVGQPGFDYHDPIFVGDVDEQAWSGFWSGLDEELQRRWKGTYDVAAIYGLRGGGAAHTFGAAAFLMPRPQDMAPRVNLTGFRSLDGYLATLKPKFRREVKARLRNLDELGRVEYCVFSESSTDAVLRELPAMLLANQQRWPVTWRAKGYYENLVRHALPAGLMHFSSLDLDGVPLSWHLGFRYRGQLCGYLSAFRSEFRNYSPGTVHVALAIAEAIVNGMSGLDFMYGNEAYKLKWADSAVQLYAFKRHEVGLAPTARNLWSERAKPHLVRTRRALTKLVR